MYGRTMTSGNIALPSRQFGADEPAPYPERSGGEAGPVALPSRLAGPADAPSPVTTAINPAAGDPRLRQAPSISYGEAGYGRAQATPHATISLHVIRRFVASGAAAVARYIVATPAPTGSTLNATPDQGAPRSPIPVFRRFLVESLVEPYGKGRVWADYYSPPEVQKNAATRRLLSGEALPRMRDPYLPKLTRLATTPTGQPGQQVLQLGATATPAPNPYAGGVYAHVTEQGAHRNA